jgi:dienelactone hydrolase
MFGHPNVGAVLVSFALVIAAAPSMTARALEPERVTITSSLASKGSFTAQFLRPPGSGRFPAVVALHGCGGLFSKQGHLARREADWAQRFLAAGYAVLFPDSFTARGVEQICTAKRRSIFPKDRADDVAAAVEWLGRHPAIDAERLALIGWSHGAMTVLWAVRAGFMSDGPQFKAAIGFYPGCREIARLPDWRPRVPLTILMGAADDWTRPGPCRDFALRTGFRFIEYPGAHHDFDAPGRRVRIRTGLGAVKGGRAHVGTDPAARAAAIDEVMKILAAALGSPR